MTYLEVARRLLCCSALMMMGSFAINVVTRDAWWLVGQIVAVASAVIAAIAVLIFLATGLRRLAALRPKTLPVDTGIAPHEQGLTGLEAPDARSSRELDAP